MKKQKKKSKEQIKKFTLDPKTLAKIKGIEDALKVVITMKTGIDMQMENAIKVAAIKLGVSPGSEKTNVELNVDTDTGVLKIKYTPRIIKPKV